MKTIKNHGEMISILSYLTIHRNQKETGAKEYDLTSLFNNVDYNPNKIQQDIVQKLSSHRQYLKKTAKLKYQHNKVKTLFKNSLLRNIYMPASSDYAVINHCHQANPIKTEFFTNTARTINKLKSKTITQALKIACIMDEFTFLSFQPEAELLALTPESWLSEIKKFQPDMLFIESAWQGKNELWKSKISGFADEVKDLLAYCHQQGIRSMFWNKEDPIHFGTFLEVAKHVNIVFTTDMDCIDKYKSAVGHDDVYLLPFAAQPKIHNPLEKYKRKDRFNFAGSFYLKYPERQRDFLTIANIAHQSKGLDIYDRNYDKSHPHYSFPDYFKPYILGRLPANKIDQAYKAYLYGINLNTIKQSQSMFARRVFELLASNTVVMSNYSRGVRNFFGDLVLCSDNAEELNRQLAKVLSSHDNLNKFRLEGLRSVLSEHTYAKRLSYIASKLKLNIPRNQQKIAVFAMVNTQEELKQIENYFTSQTYDDKLLFILNTSGISLQASLANIIIKNNSNEIIADININNITYLAFFVVNNYYGHNYLLDMSLSYQYSQYQAIEVVTKGSYFKVTRTGDVYQVNQGKAYSIVSSFELPRSMLPIVLATKYITLFVDKPDALYIGLALSIDEFNYLEDYSNNLTVEQKYLTDYSLAKDYGVNFKNNILYQAENIQAKCLFDKTENVLASFSQVKSKHQLIKCFYQGDQFKINSVLDTESLHRICLVKHNNIYGYTHLQINSVIYSVGKIGFIIDFYSFEHQKISSEILNLQNSLKIRIPQNSQYFKIYIKIKGVATLVMKKFQVSLLQLDKKILNSQNSDNSRKISFSAQKIADCLIMPVSTPISITEQNNKIKIVSKLAPSQSIYCYLKPTFSREELNLMFNSEFQLIAEQKGEFRIVFEFQDENKQKIACSINPIIGKGALPIPPECQFIRIGLKISGSGTLNINKLEVGRIDEEINCLIAKSDTLVIAKQYPAYEQLYNYGFLHTRLKTYKQHGYLVDMFRLTAKEEEFGFREFEGIDIISNNHQLLDTVLATGQYKRLLIHILDQNMWQVVAKYQDKLDIYIWIHGAEAQLWSRRAYDLVRFNEEEVQQQKKLSDGRKQFWQQLLKNKSPRVKLIFVSNYSKTEFEQDMEVSLDENDIDIIHNYIDGELFTYQEKPSQLSKKILSIRPYASLTYANDLMVKTILELSKSTLFNSLEFMVVGDGELFEETIEPLKQFDNVTIHQGFLNHQQIASLHQEYGIFLVPTRMDSQGVSRGEAMSSGLVPITNKVAAIPEFVDANSGLLLKAEDYKGMAKAILKLNKNTALFTKLSKGAATRVRKQSGFDNTILREINIVFES